ncbi:MAG: hypothetical protein PHX83_05450 [Acidobacteriia bacterium]|nr:hypothetical protein [Terriglobia bacterium]
MKKMFAVGLMWVALCSSALAATEGRWLHIKVDSKEVNGEMVRVNVPLSFAEKVLPTLNMNRMHQGRVRMGDMPMQGVDLRAMLDAVKTTGDSEFVTVQSEGQNVRIAKVGDSLIIKVSDEGKAKQEAKPKAEGKATKVHKHGPEQVDIKIPISVVEALLSGNKGELNIAAAVRALADYGDTVLLTVQDAENTVRMWVDSKNISEK